MLLHSKTKSAFASWLLPTAQRSVLFLAGLFLAAAFVASLLLTGVIPTGSKEDIIWMWDSPLAMLAILAAICAAVWLLRGWLERIEPRNLAHVVEIWFLVMGALLIFGAKCGPIADQQAVIDMAASWNVNDFSFLQQDYMRLYPQQLGLTAYAALQAALVGSGTYQFFQMLNCFWLMGMVAASWRMVELLFEKRGITNLYLISLIPCLPLIFYCAFVYGEIASLSLGVIALALQMRYLKKGGVCYLVGSAVSLGVAVLLRQNLLILMIAMILVQLLTALEKKQISCAVLALTLAVSVFGMDAGLKAFVNSRSEYKIPKGMPASGWIAMGMQQKADSDLCGVFNGYSLQIAGDTDYDSEQMAVLAAESIRQSAGYMVTHPVYTLKFYTHKLLQQWCEPSLNMLIMTHSTYTTRPAWLQAMWNGEAFYSVYGTVNILQSWLYLFALAEVLVLWRRRNTLQQTFALYFVGGFLFSILWEAKARYVLAYYVMLAPLAAAGTWNALHWLAAHWPRRKTKMKTEAAPTNELSS